MRGNLYQLTGMAAAIVLLGACHNFVHLKAKGGAEGPGKSTVAPILFDDYEGAEGQAYSYGDTANGGACEKPVVTEEEAHGGKKSFKIGFKTGTGTWGCGFDVFSGAQPKEGYFDATGTISLEFWAKLPIGVNLQAMLSEGKGNGGDGEVYLMPEVAGNGRWKKYTIQYALASRGIYSGNQNGDDEFSPSSIASVNFQFGPSQGDGTLYLDDMYFK